MKALLTLLFCLSLGTTTAPISELEDAITEDVEIVEVAEETPEAEEKLDFGQILQKYITPETISACTSAVTAIFAILKLLGFVKKEKQIKIKSAEEISKELKKTLEGYDDALYDTIVNKAIQPLSEKINQIGPTLDLFAKVLALSQTNTPESKIAILELLQKLGTIDTTSEKQEVIKQVEATENKKAEQIEALEKIENNNIEGRY